MRLKIDVMEREWKNLEFKGHLNEAERGRVVWIFRSCALELWLTLFGLGLEQGDRSVAGAFAAPATYIVTTWTAFEHS